MAKNPILQEINIANYASILLLPLFFCFLGGRWWHPAMSGKLRYGRKRTFTDMDGHLRTAGDSQLSAGLLLHAAVCTGSYFCCLTACTSLCGIFFIFQYLLASTSSSRAFSSGVPMVIRRYFPVISPGK